MKLRKSSVIFLLVVGFIVLAYLVLRTRGPQVDEVRSFTIAKAWWPGWDTFQIGVHRRETTELRFQTTFRQTGDYVAALNQFQKDNVDAATLTIYEAILAASRGTPLKIVLALDYTIGSDGVVAKKSVTSLLDLKGKRIGIEQGTIAHFTLLKALEKAGLERTEVQLVNLDLDGLRRAFLDDEVDAVGTYEPYMSNLARQGDGHIVFSSSEIPRAICDVLFVKEAVARECPDVIDHWIVAWNDMLNFKGSEPEEYLRTLSLLNGTPVEDPEESLKGIFLTNLAENRRALGSPDRPGYLLTSLKEMEKFMLQEEVIKEPLPLQELIEFEGVQRFYGER
jgi:NitT/TauT family transport system substrate-binding protein